MSLILKRALHWAGSALALLGIVFVALRLRDYGAGLDFSRFDTTKWSVVGGFALIYGLANLMLALAWWNLLEQFGVGASRRWAIKTYGISQLAKYVPGNIFHLAGRQAMGVAAGAPGWALAKSSVWELGLISFSGAVFGLLALPLLIPELPVKISVGMFATVIVMAASLFWHFVGIPVTRAFGWYVIFLAISGLLFVGLIELLVESPITEGMHWLPLAGAYILAWLMGLVTPGAPAGLGVRELVLLFLLKGVVSEAELVLAVLLGRMVTAGGDVLIYIISMVMNSNNGIRKLHE
jgi:glycosyltransferase 2 family protein